MAKIRFPAFAHSSWPSGDPLSAYPPMIRPNELDDGGEKPPFDINAIMLRIERSLRKASPGEVDAAQECFYDAMEAPTEEAALRLLTRVGTRLPSRRNA